MVIARRQKGKGNRILRNRRKRLRLKLVRLLVLTLLLSLAACGGSSDQAGPTEEAAATKPPPPPEPAQEDQAGESPDSDASTEPETGDNQQSASTDNAIAGTPTSTGAEPVPGASGGPLATAEASGLPINPDPIVPGEEYIILGTIINVAMIPVDAPQFLIEGDNGVRYRVDAQAVADIFVEDGTQLLPHQFRPGLRVMATASLPADATATDVARTTNLVILLDE